MLLQMMVRVPTLISQLPDKIQSVCLNNLPDIIPQLAVWVISANNVRVATFLRQLQTLSSHRGGTSQTSHTTRHLVNGLKWDRNPISGPISDIANLLAELYKKGYCYSSLNAYCSCSAISSTHEKVDGPPVGQHPTIVRVLKGAYNKRPPLPKYSTIWEVSKVTSYIISLDDNNALSLKLLSLKLVVLSSALIRPSRSNDLSNLNLKAMKVLPMEFNLIQSAWLCKPSSKDRVLQG